MKTKNNICNAVKLILAFFFIQNNVFAKIQSNWGKVYDVRYINNTYSIPAANTDIQSYFMDPSTGFFSYFINEINSNSLVSDFTIVFPLRTYYTSQKLALMLSGVNRSSPFTVNLIGYNQAPNYPINSAALIINANIPTTQIAFSSDPSSPNFADLTNTNVSLFPTLKWDNALENVNVGTVAPYALLCIYNSPAYNPSNILSPHLIATVNVMGLHIDGYNPHYDPSSIPTHPFYDKPQGFEGLFINNTLNTYVDNNIIENVYGNGMHLQNGDYALWDGLTRNNDYGMVTQNLVKNCWGLKPSTSYGAFDNYGDGIQIIGMKNMNINQNYVENDISATGQFGRAAVAFQGNGSFYVTSNFLKGYDRNIHCEADSDKSQIIGNRSTGSFLSLSIAEAAQFSYNDGTTIHTLNIGDHPLTITDNYFSTEGTPIEPNSYNPIHPNGYPYVYITGLVYSGLVTISNAGSNSLNYGADKTIFYRNKLVYNDADFTNWTGGLAIRYPLFFNVNNLYVDCNAFKSLSPAIPNNTLLFMMNCNGGSFASYTGNSFLGNYSNVISCPASSYPASTIVSKNDYSFAITPNGTNAVDPHFTQNPMTPSWNNCANNYFFDWTLISFTNLTCNNTPDGSINVSTTLGAGGTINYTLMPSTSGSPNNTGNFTGLGANIYTVTATDGVSNITTIITVSQPTQTGHCCSPNGSSIAAMNNIILLDNPTSSSLIAQYGNSISNRTLYIDNTFTIDQPITFIDCTLYFTPAGKVWLNSGASFHAYNTTLEASCTEWGGIVGIYSSNKVSLINSTIRNSNMGIHLLNNAVIDAENSVFKDNNWDDIYLSKMTLNPYPGIIKGNTFTTQTNLTGSYLRNIVGIELDDVKDITIGDQSTPINGNHFDHMRTGILIYNSLTGGSNDIKIYNNTFSDIHDELDPTLFTPKTIVGNCFTSEAGAAIYSDMSGYPLFNGNITVSSNMGNTASFKNCDKAIATVGSALNAKYLVANNCLLGIMCSSPYIRNYIINNNLINNSHMGIALSGLQSSATIENNNVISDFGIIDNISNGMNYKAPIGIKIEFALWWPCKPIIYYNVNNNTVDLRAEVGVGIMSNYARANMHAGGNTVNFTTTSTNSTSYFNRRDLIGFDNEVCTETIFEDNAVYGTNNATIASAKRSKGMFFNQGEECILTCNKSFLTNYGFYVWGNHKHAQADKVTYNKFNGNKYPWWFDDHASAGAGSFGNVGSGTLDNRNEFLYAGGGAPINWLNSFGYKVYRSGNSQINEKIFTDPSLLSLTSSGPIGPYAYKWQDPFLGSNYIDPCVNNGPGDGGGGQEIASNSDEINQALEVANDNVTYINYPIVGSWIDKHRLYARLDADTVLRNSDADLLTFYNTYHNDIIADITEADLAIQNMNEEGISPIVFDARYADAVNRSNLIVSSNSWEENERIINLMDIKFSRLGIDSLTIDDKDFAHALALSCPYNEGTAVYKARVLWTNFEPDAVYDDRILCLPQSQNKTTGSSQNANNINIDSLYESQVVGIKVEAQSINANTADINKQSKISETEISVYPNPASSLVVVKYESESDGYFKLYNNVSELVLETTLSKSINKTQVQLQNIANGIYQYEIEFTNGIKTRGKLTITK